MSGARLIVKNYQEFRSQLEKYDTERLRAARIAVRKEAFDMRNMLKSQIRMGQAGWQRFAPLRAISKAPPTSKRAPLAALAVAVRYWEGAITIKDGESGFYVGFDDGKITNIRGNSRAYRRTSRSWINIAEIVQEGDQFPVGGRRKILAGYAAGYRKRKQYPAYRQYFFLRKTTTEFILPPRPIIEPFWAKHKEAAAKNILSNFNRKMAGERI